MKKILLIEDDGALVRDLSEEFKLKHEIKCAYSYASAIGFWKKYSEDFDCIILDLNINPDGLDTKITDKYFPIQGMAILDYICENKTEKEIKQIQSKTVIYSGYIGAFREKKHDIKFFNPLKLIPKTGTSISELLDCVENFLKI
jgi:CheY-like chemotaxis protein